MGEIEFDCDDLPIPNDVALRRELARLRAEVEAILAPFLQEDEEIPGMWWAIDAARVWDPHARGPHYKVFNSRDEAVAFLRGQSGSEG